MTEAYTSAGLATHLYSGVFPTVPIKNNDHALGGDCAPNCTYDKTFKAYGKLFDAIRGRRWVLDTAKPAEVTTRNALANLFMVPDGSYIAAVAFAPLAGKVGLTVRGLALSCPKPALKVLVPANQAIVTAKISGLITTGPACDGGWGGSSDVMCIPLELQFGAGKLAMAGNITSSIALVVMTC